MFLSNMIHNQTMPKKRIRMSADQVLAQLQGEIASLEPREIAEIETSVLGHHTRTVLAVALVEGREVKQLSQKQLAELSGVPQPEISRLEGGLANPTLDTMVKLMVALDLQMALVPAKYKLVKS